MTKGLNLNGVARVLRGKFDKFANPVVLGLDATKFDAHVSSEALRFEHGLYTTMCRDEQLGKLLSWQIANKGKSFLPDGKVKYFRDGGRMSGDMNTGLGNCVLMCAMVFGYAASVGVAIELANNGDDCVIFMEEGDLPTFVAGVDGYFASLGFRLTSEDPVYIFERLEFCQMHPVFVDGDWRMVRKPSVAIEKDTTCILQLDGDQYLNWLAGVAQCGLAACDGVPVMGAFYKSLQLASAGYSPGHVELTGMHYLSKGMHAKGAQVTDEARFSFYLAYGLTPADQEALEESFGVPSRQRLAEFYPTLRPLDVPHHIQHLYISTS